MKPLFIACLLCTPAFANDWTCAADGGVMFKSHQVINLPQDQDKCYCTIFSDASPQARQVERWFNTNPELAKLKQSTHFHVLDTNSVMFRSRYDATTGDTPCVRIQKADGTVIYQCSHDNLPLSAEALANSIQSSCLRRRNTQPAPQPQNNLNYHLHYQVPDEKTQPDVTPQPDLFTKEPQQMDIPVWTYFVIGGVAVVLGIGAEWIKEFRNRG